MFAKATANFLEEVDPTGNLIPVSSCNDSFNVLSIVRKQKGGWLFQKTKYVATGFTLNDILRGDTLIQPAVTLTEFANYTQSGSEKSQAGLEANLHPELAKLEVEHKGTSKHNISFGSLKKEDLNLPQLIKDSKGRFLDMHHSLIKQAREKDGVFGLVTQKIVTTQTSTISQGEELANSLGGQIRHMVLKMCLKANASLTKGRSLELTIQPHTTIAYKQYVLRMKPKGDFGLDFLSEKSSVTFQTDDWYPPGCTWLTEEVATLSRNFALLSGLKASIRTSLLQHLISVMMQCGAVHLLERVLSQMLDGKRPSLDCVEIEPQRQALQVMLDVLSDEDNGLETEDSSSPLGAFHLVTSALAEMPDDGLAVLMSSCTPRVLRSLALLVQCVIENGEMSLSSDDLAPLTGETFQLTELLFSSCGVELQRDGDVLKTKLSESYQPRPLVLCLAIKGLASMANC
ncbi:gasdermin-E-like isoform X1 [Gadus chalcogrammus]|nr:gasdermin-E-like isoform X1 [Gadus chalcogrammus]XP_056458899.1 gasdermin-E-like isoform X1 [Gadus chalcogrammus]XP_056458900.1 gasdermin-E-like isoform X1 [Gadus chalcogrammus]XP_056458901.1 gasdermin-E-like isoform X1 [Gadus chalcogrammus]